ncbi:MAG: glycosyltransferase family 2 protein [Calditrichia bacterium]
MNEPFNDKSEIGILIPAYNPDPLTFAELLRRVFQNCRSLNCHVLVVDDGSDPAITIPAGFSGKVALLRHSENRGKGAALKSGFQHLLQNGSLRGVITLDCDLQHPPEKICDFISVWNRGEKALVVGARRRSPRLMPLHRIASNTITSFVLSRMAGQPIADSQCGFRFIDRRVLEAFQLKENRFHLESELLVRAGWKGFSIAHVPIPTIYNQQKSAINHVGDTLNFVSLLFKLIKERYSG